MVQELFEQCTVSQLVKKVLAFMEPDNSPLTP